MFLIGHSHANAIISAAKADRDPLKVIQLRDYRRREILNGNELGTRLKRDVDQLLSETGGGPVFSTIGGALHVVLGLFQHPIPFDFILPDRDEAPASGAMLLPYNAVRATIQARTDFHRRIVVALKRHLSVPLIHLDCPPPTEHIDILRDNPRRSTPPTLEASPPALRYKLWLVNSQIMERFCRKLDIVFVPPPAETLDSNGFLLDHFHRDAAHGNDQYGRLVIAQMKAFT